MENATDALKIAAFTLLFIGALSIAMITLSKAKKASEAIIHTQDERNYYSFVSDDEIMQRTDNAGNRKVTIESIIPTLYRYSIENYRVEFYKEDGSELNIVERPDTNAKTNILDLANEQKPTLSVANRKEMIDGTVEKLMSREFKDATFIEKLGVYYEEDRNDEGDLVPSEEEDPNNANKTTKRTIRYIINK